uniref:E3 ubiquitin-protein ligase Topors n=1 Tax=Nothobranchius pienaari TaxID=704102 RepID=A0A1A8MDX5_9TELE
MSAVQIALQHNQNSARGKNSKAMSGEASPDSKCPICLDRFNNISHLDRCLHKFCFRCILEWSKNKAECPLCKQPFRSIYHSVKSDQDFQRYEIKQQVENASFGYFEGVRFRYRTTFTGVRATRRTSPPPDNGVMFEAATRPTLEQHRDHYIRRMMTRLEAKRRAEREGRAVNSVREQEMINFRRELYRRGVRVQSVKDGGRSRNTSAEFYRRNPACLHRLVPWLKRELMVLYGAHGSLVNIVQHIIMSRITRYDMEDGEIQGELRPFLQGRTEHFLHEFLSFAKSPFNMEAYDQHAVYDCPAPSGNEGSSSNSSVIAISEDEETFAEVDPPGEPTSLSHSLWDDETPGPSYSTSAEQREATTMTPLNLDSDISSEEEMQEFEASPHRQSSHNPAGVPQSDRNEEDRVSSDSEDCVIIGFVKPTAERTPELVHLSSDSNESEIEDTEEAPLPPHHIRFTSCSPAASHRSGSVRVGQSPETDRHRQLDSKERSLTSRRHKTSKKPNSNEKNRRYDSKDRVKDRHKPKDREHRRKRGNSKSRERRLSSRSPENSNSSLSSQSAETDSSYSRGRDFSKSGPVYRRKDGDHSYQSYSHYRRDKNGSVTRYTHRQSYYYSSNKYSRSRSRSRSRDSQRRHRRWSRSRSCSSSPSTKRKSHHNKPGGKRKYKTRHLEDSSKDLLQDARADGDPEFSTKHKKKSKERRHKTSRRSSCSVEDTKNREERDRSKHHHKKKKKHKKTKRHKHEAPKSKSSLAVITIDSDSDSVCTFAKSILTDEQANPRAEDSSSPGLTIAAKA